jgi:hypothetical protein
MDRDDDTATKLASDKAAAKNDQKRVDPSQQPSFMSGNNLGATMARMAHNKIKEKVDDYAETGANSGKMAMIQNASYLASQKTMAGQLSKKVIGKKRMNMFKLWTGRALKTGWTNIIETFGLSFLIVDFIVFLQLIFGKEDVCELGHEWVPDEIAQTKPEEAKEMGEKLKLVEGCGCCFLNIILLFIVISAIVIIAILKEMAEHPVYTFFEAAKSYFGF